MTTLFSEADVIYAYTRRREVMMQTTRRKTGWWITDVPECDDCGPYTTRAEADDDRRGLERFGRWGHKRAFVTCEPQAKTARGKK